MFVAYYKRKLWIYCFEQKKRRFLLSLNEMAEYQPTEEHLRHCMLFHYQLGFNATIATKKICRIYGNVLKVHECRRWFRKFAKGDFDLSRSIRNVRSDELDSDTLKSEQDLRLIVQKIADSSASKISENNLDIITDCETK